jgi:hypothetical protein
VFADLTPAEADALKTASAAVSADELVYLLRAFLDADTEMRKSPYPRVELEIAAARTTRRPEPQALDTLLAKVEEALGQLRTGSPGPGRPTVTQESLLTEPPTGATSPRTSAPAPAPKSESPRTPNAAERPARAERGEGTSAPRAAGQDSGDRTLADSWQRVVADVMAKKALLGSVLQHATPLAVADGVLQLGLGGNHFHKELLADRANRDLVTQVLQQHVPGARRFEVDAGEAGGGARNHPAVRAALNVFQGEVVSVRPRAPEEGEPQ